MADSHMNDAYTFHLLSNVAKSIDVRSQPYRVINDFIVETFYEMPCTIFALPTFNEHRYYVRTELISSKR